MNTFLALGDSYTVGEGIDHDATWGHQLARALRQLGAAIVDPKIVATTGFTTVELAARLDALDPLGNDWDLVSLLIGVNNQYRDLPLAQFETEFTALLDRARKYAKGDAQRLLVLSIPDWGVTPFGGKDPRGARAIAEAVDAHNAVVARVCEANGVRFVDITDLSRRYGADADMLAADGLHPSANMYGLWASRALDTARTMPGLQIAA